jgi:hypothetical protein
VKTAKLIRRARHAARGLAAAILALSAGCVGGGSAMESRLAEGGYALWYPAEAGIEPGQVWLQDGALRAKLADRPAALPVAAADAPAAVRDGSRYVRVRDALDPEFTKTQMSKAGPFSAELYAGSVRDGTVRYGEPTVASVSAADLAAAAGPSAPFGTGYAKAVEMARDGRPGVLLVASVVRVPEVVFTLECLDPNLLVSRLPRLRAITDARVDVQVVEANYARLTLRPPPGSPGLVVGLLPVRGERLDAPAEAARRAFAADARYATRQEFAVRGRADAVTGGDRRPLVAADAPAEAVERAYRRATGTAEPADAAAPRPGSASPATAGPAAPGPAPALPADPSPTTREAGPAVFPAAPPKVGPEIGAAAATQPASPTDLGAPATPPPGDPPPPATQPFVVPDVGSPSPPLSVPPPTSPAAPAAAEPGRVLPPAPPAEPPPGNAGDPSAGRPTPPSPTPPPTPPTPPVAADPPLTQPSTLPPGDPPPPLPPGDPPAPPLPAPGPLAPGHA